MNIALFSPSQNPYSETFVQAHKNYLKGKVFYYYGTKGRVKLEGHDLSLSKFSLLRYRVLRKFYNYSFSFINNKTVLHSLKEKAIDVILVEYGTHAFNLIEILKSCGLPIVVHFHGYDASKDETLKKCNNYKEVFAFTKKVIAVSKVMEQQLLNLGCPREKLVYNANGSQPEFEFLTLQFSKKQFVGVGRFADKKAPYYTILAFNEVLKKHPDAKLLLAGDGVLLNTCMNLVEYLNISNQVEFLGIIKPEQFQKILCESLAFVQHSITALNGDKEGMPIAVLEASSAGLPVISTKHAGIIDVIIDGKTGYLSNEHDVSSMTKFMLQFLDDVNLAKQMGAAGRKYIAEHFSFQHHIDGIQCVLAEAIEIS